MCGGIHYGDVEGLVSTERWSCSRGTVQYFICGGIIQTHPTYCTIDLLRCTHIHLTYTPRQEHMSTLVTFWSTADKPHLTHEAVHGRAQRWLY